jgi:hypothetical protein
LLSLAYIAAELSRTATETQCPRRHATSRLRRRTSVLPSPPCRAQARGLSRLSTRGMPLRHPSCPIRGSLHFLRAWFRRTANRPY